MLVDCPATLSHQLPIDQAVAANWSPLQGFLQNPSSELVRWTAFFRLGPGVGAVSLPLRAEENEPQQQGC
jgi:hypothetical protein